MSSMARTRGRVSFQRSNQCALDSKNVSRLRKRCELVKLLLPLSHAQVVECRALVFHKVHGTACETLSAVLDQSWLGTYRIRGPCPCSKPICDRWDRSARHSDLTSCDLQVHNGGQTVSDDDHRRSSEAFFDSSRDFGVHPDRIVSSRLMAM